MLTTVSTFVIINYIIQKEIGNMSTGNWENYLTENGKTKWDFFKKHNLGKYYEPMMGNLAIDNDDWETVKNDVLLFIAEYWEQRWALTYNDECEMWFVTQIED